MPTDADHALLAETIARHFEDAKLDGTLVDLGFAGLRMRCRVNDTGDFGPQQQHASLFFNLEGGELGPAPVFMSISGYAENTHDAIVTGGCNWACAFGPVLRASFGGEPIKELASFDVTVDGQTFRVFCDSLDRANTEDGAALARKRFPDRWLTSTVLRAARLPLLPAKGPTVLSVFVGDYGENRLIEVKVNGVDWPAAHAVFNDVPSGGEQQMALLRELAVLIPLSDAPPLSRTRIERTIDGLTYPINGVLRPSVAWRGYRRHGGVVEAPMTDAQLEKCEQRLGMRLPEDYRSFLRTISESGAGPGYGLYSPRSDGQRDLAEREGTLALAHAGCGNMWLLMLKSGEVWIDRRGLNKGMQRTHATFTEWYRAWLDGCVRSDERFLPWRSDDCVIAGLSSLDGMTLRSGDAYWGSPCAIDPCEACIALIDSYGLDDTIIAEGEAPKRFSTTPPLEPGFFARLFGR